MIQVVQSMPVGPILVHGGNHVAAVGVGRPPLASVHDVFKGVLFGHGSGARANLIDDKFGVKDQVFKAVYANECQVVARWVERGVRVQASITALPYTMLYEVSK
jgi:hypothetical protein